MNSDSIARLIDEAIDIQDQIAELSFRLGQIRSCMIEKSNSTKALFDGDTAICEILWRKSFSFKSNDENVLKSFFGDMYSKYVETKVSHSISKELKKNLDVSDTVNSEVFDVKVYPAVSFKRKS